MKVEDIQPGKTYIMTTGPDRKVERLFQSYLGYSVEYRRILKGGRQGEKIQCLATTFISKVVREAEEAAHE
ncbi:hypothetical protein HGI30_14975 [Paenibacillus albicereus]|uniref:Uncharacterized protein n=1 Tax=Paenibacillus albicereus TaxID=2726185 RepID=A0A6H2GZA4_9BACL|nr:hypothetical protein [Paenibacillus albicereus]QJC52735.1 hypothetical protein HGI30_14975 [Paenibacillus albicereus]